MIQESELDSSYLCDVLAPRLVGKSWEVFMNVSYCPSSGLPLHAQFLSDLGSQLVLHFHGGF